MDQSIHTAAAERRFSDQDAAQRSTDMYDSDAPVLEESNFRGRRDVTVDSVLRVLPPRGRVLDLGCGSAPVLSGNKHTLLRQFALLVLCTLVTACSVNITREDAGPRADGAVYADCNGLTGTLWAPHIDCIFDNPTINGNPFDIEVNVTFTHSASNQVIRSQMFYDGGTTWKLRFTGVRTGAWTFLTESSDDPDLHGHTGTIKIEPNPDPNIHGFTTSVGNQFARQVGEDGEFEVFALHEFWDAYRHVDPNYSGLAGHEFWDAYRQDYPGLAGNVTDLLNNDYVADLVRFTLDRGSTHVSITINNEWFLPGARSYQQHSNEDPHLETFRALENAITIAHSMGAGMVFWAWGDEYRQWTPIGVGGINGVPDQRLQRYIAARLGPLPGWSMGYGFDLEEWVTEAQLQVWADYLNAHWGWPHLVWARGRSNSSLSVISYSDLGPRGYNRVTADMDSDTGRPHLYEERDMYTRSVDMDQTRRQMWVYAMAGGVAGSWGIYWGNGSPDYPNPEQLRAHARFWRGRLLQGMVWDNGISDGYVLRTSDRTRYVFYREDATSIRMDLSGMNGSQPAVAIDTKLDYAEINLGPRTATDQTWAAPYASDWAIAVGGQ